MRIRRQLRRNTIGFGMLALTLALAGCSQSEGDFTRPSQPRTTVEVENRSFNQVTIYVYRGSERARLGQVSGSSTQTFTIPERMLFGISTLRFVADPLAGSGSPTSHEVAVTPGDQLRLTIPPM